MAEQLGVDREDEQAALAPLRRIATQALGGGGEEFARLPSAVRDSLPRVLAALVDLLGAGA